MSTKSNGRPFDLVNYLFHLKHLQKISTRRNLYSIVALKSKPNLRLRESEEEMKLQMALSKSNKSIQKLKKRNLPPIALRGKSDEFIEQFKLYRQLEESKLKRQHESLKAQFKLIKSINERNNSNERSFISDNSFQSANRERIRYKST